MSGDLVSSCVVGDVITAVGLVKVLATGDDLGGLVWGLAGRGQALLLDGQCIRRPARSIAFT